jgi:biotin carboxylase
VQHGSYEEQSLLALNEQLLQRFGIEHGVTHAEFIRRRDRSGDIFYFLEVAARVGGAYTAETVHAATGINLWREWARIEIAPADRPYKLPPVERNYGGIAVSLARQEFPDTSHYSDPEIVYRVRKAHHVGLVLRSSSYERITSLLDQYRVRFEADFTAVAPAEESTEQYL